MTLPVPRSASDSAGRTSRSGRPPPPRRADHTETGHNGHNHRLDPAAIRLPPRVGAPTAPPRVGAPTAGRRLEWDGTLDQLWSWQARARCRTADPELFFGPDGERPGPQQRHREQAARTICRRCPVRRPCAAYALASGETHGVWGGLSEAERAAVGRHARQAAPAVAPGQTMPALR